MNVATLILLASAGGEATSVEELNWAVVSMDAAVEVAQTATGKDACRVACRKQGGQQELWAADRCLAHKSQLRFVSNDGDRLMVIDPLPARAGSSWKITPVVFFYRRGELEKALNAGALVRDATKVRELAKHFYWLGGTLSIPGKPPQVRADAAGIELETIDGRALSLRFDATDLPRDPATASAKKGKGKKR